MESGKVGEWESLRVEGGRLEGGESESRGWESEGRRVEGVRPRGLDTLKPRNCVTSKVLGEGSRLALSRYLYNETFSSNIALL